MSKSKPIRPLPENFIWGTSSSAYQTEGGNVASNWDRYNAENPSQDRYALSVDFRHRYREDLGLAKDLGCNTHRFGINWARVEPREGEFDEGELQYYDDVIRVMLEAGLEPLLTLDHFVYPGWVDRLGGWVNPRTPELFVRFCTKIAERYHRQIRLWLTFNEAAFFVLFEQKYRKLDKKGVRTMSRHLVAAHREVYDLIHRLRPDAIVSSNVVVCPQGLISRWLQWYTDGLFLNHVVDKLDWMAIDFYYGRIKLKALISDRFLEQDPNPKGLYAALQGYARKFPDLPILIAENGMPTQDNKPRPDGITRSQHLTDAIYWTQRAHADGINVIGYMYWSLTDNFEWGHYGPRFGLYSVDVINDPTLTRKPTDAVDTYKALIRKRGVPAFYSPRE